MLITPLGVGDAWDAEQVNATCLLELDGYTLLIDCGHSAAAALWRSRPEPDAIDSICLTHLHCDHVLGLPAVLERWSWEGRRKRLDLVTTTRGRDVVRQLCALVGVEPRFEIRYADIEAPVRLGPFALRSARTEHVVPNNALRFEAGSKRFAYSGDGRPTAASRALFADADLLLHECWVPDAAPEITFHADLPSVRAIAGPSRVGLYHVRAGRRDDMRASIEGDPRLFLAEPGVSLAV